MIIQTQQGAKSRYRAFGLPFVIQRFAAESVAAAAVNGPYHVEAQEVFTAGAVAAEAFTAGSVASEVFVAGAVTDEVN